MSDPKPISILHLEDNALDAELTFELLVSAGIAINVERIVKLEDFQRALEKYHIHHNFDLILADYNMPGFDGMTALRMTREMDEDVPFILLSGALGEELAVKLLRSGATDYVLKNNMQRLPPVVTRAIDEFDVRLREKQSQKEIRRARDEAQKANSAKGRFLSRISHELRTPLNAIIGYTQLMQSDPMSEEQEHCSGQILKAGEHLLQLINEVLDITRIESGVIPLTVKSTSIVPVIERATDLVRPMARDANVTIHIDGGPCDLFAHVDQDRLTQVLINLLTNAIKYNKPGGQVYVECQEEIPGTVKLLVRDTGIGISPDKMERLFTPFDRLDLEKDSAIPGTGLGLTVSKALVEAMAGTLGVISSDEEGCIFWLEVPGADHVEEMPVMTSDSSGTLQGIAMLPPDCKILLVEDHNGAADFMSRVFRRRGTFDLITVNSTEEACRHLQNDQPDIIVTDLNLRGKSGDELVEILKGDEKLKDIPIIVATVDPTATRENKLIDLGVYAYFRKPLNLNKFIRALSNAYHSRQNRV